jgi:hypothetical protein
MLTSTKSKTFKLEKNLVKYFGDFPSLYTLVLYQERTISVPIDHKSRRDLAYRQPSLNN